MAGTGMLRRAAARDVTCKNSVPLKAGESYCLFQAGRFIRSRLTGIINDAVLTVLVHKESEHGTPSALSEFVVELLGSKTRTHGRSSFRRIPFSFGNLENLFNVILNLRIRLRQGSLATEPATYVCNLSLVCSGDGCHEFKVVVL